MYEKIKKEYDDVLSKVETMQGTLSSLQSDLTKVDDEITKLEGKRSELVVLINQRSKERDKLLGKAKELREKLDSMMSPEEFLKSFSSLAKEFLETCTPEELKEIMAKIASFMPVDASKSKAPESDSPECQSPTNRGVKRSNAISAFMSCALRDTITSVYGSLGTSAELTIKDGVVLPLADGELVGVFIKFLGKSLSRVEITVDICGDTIAVPANIARPVGFSPEGKFTLGVDKVRVLYAFVFIEWLRRNNADMSADSIFDYLLGGRYKKEGTQVSEDFPGSTFAYQRLETKDGVVLKEVAGVEKTTKSYVLYEDCDGNRVIGTPVATMRYSDICKRVYPCYTGGAAIKYPQEKCRRIDFRDIFDGCNITFREVK